MIINQEELEQAHLTQIGKEYKFAPRPDITPLESAWIAYFFAMTGWIGRLEQFEQWPLIERHFEEVDAALNQAPIMRIDPRIE